MDKGLRAEKMNREAMIKIVSRYNSSCEDRPTSEGITDGWSKSQIKERFDKETTIISLRLSECKYSGDK